MHDPEAAACPFCAIANGKEHPPARICEDEHWVAFFPLDPATPGHTLVIPRRHVPDLWQLDDALGRHLMAAAVKVGKAVQTAIDPQGMNLITSAGEAAEQTVFHLHLHLVPRWHDDGFGDLWPPKQPLSDALLADAAARVRAACQERP